MVLNLHFCNENWFYLCQKITQISIYNAQQVSFANLRLAIDKNNKIQSTTYIKYRYVHGSAFHL